MSEQQESTIITPSPYQSEQDSTMEEQSRDHQEAATNNKKLSFSRWLSAQRTRDTIVNCLIKTPSTPFVFSNHYRTIPQGEASTVIYFTEEEAFSIAAGSAAFKHDSIQILQVFSKVISKQTLEAIKSRNVSVSASAASNTALQPKMVDPPSNDQKVKIEST